MNSLVAREDYLPSSDLTTPANIANDCASFFGLQKIPFLLKPSNTKIFEHISYTQVKNTLLFGLSSNEKILKITGDHGSGKTLLINQVLSEVDRQLYPICILNSQISSKELLQQIIDEFGQPYPVEATTEQLLRLLRFVLYEHYSNSDTSIVLWIDNAEQLPIDTLLIIEKIVGLETPTRNLIQIILSGANELDNKLKQPYLSALSHKIRF